MQLQLLLGSNHLLQTQAPAVSTKAECVQKQTQLTRQLAKVGLMSDPVSQVRADSTIQAMMLESLSRTEGVLNFLPITSVETFSMKSASSGLHAWS